MGDPSLRLKSGSAQETPQEKRQKSKLSQSAQKYLHPRPSLL
jgi:hypothetical protein